MSFTLNPNAMEYVPLSKKILDYITIGDDDIKWPIPLVPKVNNENPTRAFVRIWENGKELVLNLDHVNGLEMDELTYAITGLTGQFLTPKPIDGVSVKPKKKFFLVDISGGQPCVYGIDEYFKKRFGNPNKKWELRMKKSNNHMVRNWGKVEVGFILY
jgi:hypothetical protein